MNSRLIPFLILGCSAIALPAQVQTFTDDFNDNNKDAAKWGMDVNVEGTGGMFSETAGRLEFHQPTVSTVTLIRPWIGASPTYSEDWEAIIDVRNELSFPTPTGGGAAISLAVRNSIDESQVVIVHLLAENYGSSFKGFRSELLANGSQTATTVTNFGSIQGGFLRLTFDSSTKVIQVHHGGQSFGSYGIAGSGGANGNDNWNMSADSPFRFAVVGGVFDSATTFSSGLLYADNFQLAIDTQATAESLVQEGRSALAAEDIATARARFEQALALDVNHEKANALLAIARLLDLPNQPSVQAFLDRLGVNSTGRDVYDWTASAAREPDGDLTIPSGLTGAEFAQHWRTNAVPEITAAIANLEKVTSQDFLLQLTAAETTFEAVDVDLGDLLLLRSGLHALEYFSYTFLAHDFNVLFSVVDTFAQSDPFDIAQFLSDHPQVLTFATTNDLAAGRAAFANAADRYAEASQFLRDRSAGVMRLFNFVNDGRNASEEQEFREVFADLRTSLDGSVAVRHAGGEHTFFAGALFTGNGALRTFLPQFQKDRMVLGSLPDPTFGGFMIGRTRDEVEEFLLTEDDLPTSDVPTVPNIVNATNASSSPIGFTAKTKIGQGYLVEALTTLRVGRVSALLLRWT